MDQKIIKNANEWGTNTYFEEADRRKGVTGTELLVLLETRLDNVVYRMGVAPSRRAARQIVSHRHITVNGEVVNVPSYHLKVGDKVAVREKSKSLEAIDRSLLHLKGFFRTQQVQMFINLSWHLAPQSG
jgi:ribosomal protein S4